MEDAVKAGSGWHSIGRSCSGKENVKVSKRKPEKLIPPQK